jgi:MFS family permease
MDAFRSFKYKNFKLFFYGQSISLLGTWIQKTAVVWLVYRLTGSAMLLGIVSFVSLIPSLLLSPYAGSYIDRHDRFKVMKNTQKLAMLQAGLLAALIYFQFYNISVIILLSLLQGIINAFDVTCRQSLMVELVDDKADLPNAIALNSTITNLARVAGPAIAGIILSTLGEDFCFISNFFSFVPVLICLYLMKLNTQPSAHSQKDIWHELKEGLDYVISDKQIVSLIILLTGSSLFVIPFTTLMPIFAKDLFNGTSGTFSLFESAIGLGSLISAVYMARLKTIDKLTQVTVVASVLFGLGVITLAVANHLRLALLGMAISGVGMMAQTSSINTYIQTHAVPAMRARAISYFVMAYMGITPIGSLLIGFLAEHLKPREVVALEGILSLVIIAAYVVYQKQAKESNSSSKAVLKAA